MIKIVSYGRIFLPDLKFEIKYQAPFHLEIDINPPIFEENFFKTKQSDFGFPLLQKNNTHEKKHSQKNKTRNLSVTTNERLVVERPTPDLLSISDGIQG